MTRIQITVDLEFNADLSPLDADKLAYKARDPSRWEDLGAWSIRSRSICVPEDIEDMLAAAIHASELEAL